MRLVFGLGSGRCGTKSLATLLDSQPGAYVTHERWHREMAWTGSERVVLELARRLQRSGAALAGDVAFYYLPYVQMIARNRDIRFVCLKRDRLSTVKSFLRKVGRGHRWIHHNGARWRRDPVWDKCFPKEDIADRAEAIGAYWDQYYDTAEKLQRQLAGRFLIVPVEALNSRRGQREILSFVGVSEFQQLLRIGMRLNAGIST